MEKKEYGFVELQYGKYYSIGGTVYICVYNNLGQIKLMALDHTSQPNMLFIKEVPAPQQDPTISIGDIKINK